jgi:hypothetical protein
MSQFDLKESTMKTLVAMGLSALLVSSCGFYIEEQERKEEAPSKVVAEPVALAPDDTSFVISGYVLNAFEVTVDGEVYQDLEDFYTRETGRLSQRVRDAGYDETWTARFEAEVGFADLWNGMSVYIAPVQKRGYQARTYVDSNGGFSALFPPKAADDEYRIRANKRISVTISNGSETKMLCYNFSAIEKSARFSDKDKPVVLDSFRTTLTSYECRADEESGIIVPENPR